MAIRAVTCVWERSHAKGSNLLMLLAIADYAKDDGRWSWPSTRTLANKTRLTERAAWQILAKLVEDGELEVDNESQPGRRNLHIRCVCEEWPTLPEMLKHRRDKEAPPAKFSGGLTPPSLQTLHSPPAQDPADPLHGGAGDPDPSDPSLKEKSAGESRGPVDAVENCEALLAAVRTIADQVLADAGSCSMGDLVVMLRAACTRAGVRAHPELVARALTSAMMARAGHRG